MKIAISELERPEIRDLDSTAAGEITGGETSVELFAEAIAEGDFSVTRIETGGWNFQFKTDLGTLDITLGGQLALAASFNAA